MLLNKYKILTMLFMIITLFGYGQNVSQISFEKAVDYCNCRVSLAYGQSYVNAHQNAKKEIQGYEIIKEKTKGCDKINPISFEELSSLLKNNSFSECEKSITQKINSVKKRYQTEDTLEVCKNNIIDVIYKNYENSIKYTNGCPKEIKVIQPELETVIEQILSPKQEEDIAKTQISPAIPSPTTQNMSDESNQLIVPPTNEIFPIEWVVSIIILLLCIATVFILTKLKTSSLEERIDRHRIDIEDLKNKNNSSSISTNHQSDAQLKKKINDLESLVTRMEKTVSELSSKIHSLEQSQDKNKQASVQNVNTHSDTQHEAVISLQKRETHTTILYLSMPSSQGVFSHVTSQPNNESFYQLIVSNTNPLEATFEFFNTGASVSQAISFPERVLNVVCDSQNSFNQHAKSIKTVEKGKLKKQQEKWILDTKAKIKYE